MSVNLRFSFASVESRCYRLVLSACLLMSVITIQAQNIYNLEPVQWVGRPNGYGTTPYNADYRTLGYRRVSVSSGNPTDGRGQWATTINVQNTGGNIAPDNMPGGSGAGWLLISGPSSNRFQNKWNFTGIGQAAVNSINGVIRQTGGNDMGLNMFTTGYYSFIFRDAGYVNAEVYIAYTQNAPVQPTVSGQTFNPLTYGSVISISTNDNPSAGENIYVRYRTGTNDFSSGTSIVQATGSGISWSAEIPQQTCGSTVYYYAFTSTRTLAQLNAASEQDRSLSAIRYDDVLGANRSYTVSPAPTAGITNNTGTTILTCAITSISLTATGSGNYSWNNGLGSGATQAITLPGTYTVTVTGSNGCQSTASQVITQNITEPAATITASGPTTFCQGGSVTLNGALPSGNTWTQKANFGGTARYGAVGFSIGVKGYLGTGSTTNDFWEYDPATNTWTQIANIGGVARAYAVAFSIGTKGYVGTGSSVSGSLRDFWEYDPSTNTWTQKANFGGVARQSAVGFSIGTKGYIGTGVADIYNSAYYSDFWEYDPVSNLWTQKANVGGGTRGYAAGFSIGNKGYIGSGLNNTFLYTRNDFWEYDPSTNQWTQKAAFSDISRQKPIGLSNGTFGYIGLGYNGSSELSDLWEYDPASNAWSQRQSFSGSSRVDASGFSIANRVYVGTGVGNTSYKDLWEYNPVSNIINSYLWSSGQTTSSITANQTGNYTLTVTGENGCSATSTPVTVTVGNPLATITTSGPTSFCEGGSVTLTASVGANYNWSNGASAQSITVNSSGSFTVTVTDANGCSATSSPVTVTVNSLPVTPVITPAGPLTICQGDSINLNSNIAVNGDQWIQKSNFGGSSRFGAFGFSIGSYGYIGTGYNNFQYTDDFWQYDPSTNSWSQKSNVGSNTRSYAAAFSIGTKGYMGTGVTDALSASNDFWEYDPQTNTWSQKASFSGTARYGAVGFSIGTKGYIGLGNDEFNNFLVDIWEYDPIINSWIQKLNFPGTLRSNSMGLSIGTKGYVGLGYDQNYDFLRDFWEFDPSANTWTQKANFGGEARYNAVGFSIANKGYVGTGNSQLGDMADMWQYDPVTNGWTQKANFGGGTRSSGVGFTIGNSGYIGTGINEGYYLKNDFWQYQINTVGSSVLWSSGQTTSSINVTQSGNYTVTVTGSNGCSSTSAPVTVIVNTCNTYTTLNLNVFLEGFYDDINHMRANIFDLGMSASSTETDTLLIGLWSPANLLNPLPDYTMKTVVHTNGVCTAMQFPATVAGNSYYIQVKHRNHIETWSSAPVPFTATTNYDFTVSQSKAYDNGIDSNPPMASVAGGKFAFYAGDINQDGGVDGQDASALEIDVNAFAFGYHASDANGDGSSDGLDASVIEINANLFIFYSRP